MPKLHYKTCFARVYTCRRRCTFFFAKVIPDADQALAIRRSEVYKHKPTQPISCFIESYTLATTSLSDDGIFEMADEETLPRNAAVICAYC
jgi:hypothetical protein